MIGNGRSGSGSPAGTAGSSFTGDPFGIRAHKASLALEPAAHVLPDTSGKHCGTTVRGHVGRARDAARSAQRAFAPPCRGPRFSVNQRLTSASGNCPRGQEVGKPTHSLSHSWADVSSEGRREEPEPSHSSQKRLYEDEEKARSAAEKVADLGRDSRCRDKALQGQEAADRTHLRARGKASGNEGSGQKQSAHPRQDPPAVAVPSGRRPHGLDRSRRLASAVATLSRAADARGVNKLSTSRSPAGTTGSGVLVAPSGRTTGDRAAKQPDRQLTPCQDDERQAERQDGPGLASNAPHRLQGAGEARVRSSPPGSAFFQEERRHGRRRRARFGRTSAAR